MPDSESDVEILGWNKSTLLCIVITLSFFKFVSSAFLKLFLIYSNLLVF